MRSNQEEEEAAGSKNVSADGIDGWEEEGLFLFLCRKVSKQAVVISTGRALKRVLIGYRK